MPNELTYRGYEYRISRTYPPDGRRDGELLKDGEVIFSSPEAIDDETIFREFDQFIDALPYDGLPTVRPAGEMQFPEQYRWIDAPEPYSTKPGDRYGAFRIPGRASGGRELFAIVADGQDTGWEHVSVSIPGQREKCPSWGEMCAVKSLFWTDDAAVVQFHPAASDHINQHPGCLHLWRCVTQPFPMPPKVCV